MTEVALLVLSLGGFLWLLATLRRFAHPRDGQGHIPWPGALLHGVLSFAMLGVGAFGPEFLDPLGRFVEALTSTAPGSPEREKATDEALGAIARGELSAGSAEVLAGYIQSDPPKDLGERIDAARARSAAPVPILDRLKEDWARKESATQRILEAASAVPEGTEVVRTLDRASYRIASDRVTDPKLRQALSGWKPIGGTIAAPPPR